MELLALMKKRHSVRQYEDVPLNDGQIDVLSKEIDIINKENNLHIQLVLNEGKAFSSGMAHYGHFKGVNNYLALIGPKEKGLEEKLGYYGEHLVLLAQSLGLNSCWVALTYKKIPSAFSILPGEKLIMVIALGKGITQGFPHKGKRYEDVVSGNDTPTWFQEGVEAALLAPTATNQQKFHFIYQDGKAYLKMGVGICIKTDKGIVKYHFEKISGHHLEE